MLKQNTGWIICFVITCMMVLCAPLSASSEQDMPNEDGPWYYSIYDALPVLLGSEITEEIISSIDHPEIVTQLNDVMSVEIQDIIVTHDYACIGLRFHLNSDSCRFAEYWEVYDSEQQQMARDHEQSMICLFCTAFINDRSDMQGNFYGFQNGGRDFCVQLGEVFGRNRTVDTASADIRFLIQLLIYDHTNCTVEETAYETYLDEVAVKVINH